MKRYLLLLLLVLMVVPVLAQDATIDITASDMTFSARYEHIILKLPVPQIDGITFETVEESVPDCFCPHDTFPEYVRIKLGGDHLNGISILVYRLGDDLERFSASSEDGFTGEVERLLALMDERPALEDYVAASIESDLDLPFLPLARLMQFFRAKPEYITTEHVRGIRYLAYYESYDEPLTDAKLRYTFQGISTDGRFYVAMRVPVTSGLLDSTGNVEELEAFTAVAQMLNDLDSDMYSPSLNLLDSLVDAIQFLPESEANGT